MKLPVLAAVCGLLAAPTYAASISVTAFSADSDLAAQYLALQGDIALIETFESFSVGEVTPGSALSTSVGDFITLGGVGTGGTVVAPNTGTNVAIREGDVFGRTDTTGPIFGDATANQFLDSNDTDGIEYTADLGGSYFKRILLTVTDAADRGSSLTIVAGGASETLSFEQDNGNRQLVEVIFSESVNLASLLFSNSSPSSDDGFSIDDVGVDVVPLPASALLLLGGLGGMSLLRRKKA